jgi:16S rRNA A1518/A1519 N6-dimethyltransferase RsmA/KsgA/DIM1 with predicted DNA glycosylase/AP lyase activity
VEIEKNTRRICLMNTFLHNLDANIIYGDALTDDVAELDEADVIVANPPLAIRLGDNVLCATIFHSPIQISNSLFCSIFIWGLELAVELL